VKLYVHSLVEKLKRFYENARCYNKIYSKNFINNFNQLNMFRATISPILRSTSLCLQLVVYIYYVCICVCLKKVGIFFFFIFQLHYSHTRFKTSKCLIWSDSLLWAFVRPPPKPIFKDHLLSTAYE